MIFVTGSNEPATLLRIATDHAHAVLIKPVSEHQLIVSVNDALDRPVAA